MGERTRRTGGDPVVASASASGATGDWGYLALAYSPYLLNDFLFIFIDSVGPWLAADYGTRIASIALLLAVPALRTHALRRDRRRCSRLELILLVIVAIFVMRVVGVLVSIPLDTAVPSLDLFDYPRIETPWLRVFDLTVGLAFVAVTEELVGRRIAFAILKRHIASPLLIVALSSVTFGLMHWSHGLGSMLSAIIAGAILMAVYMRTGSLMAVISIHFAVNLWSFS